MYHMYMYIYIYICICIYKLICVCYLLWRTSAMSCYAHFLGSCVNHCICVSFAFRCCMLQSMKWRQVVCLFDVVGCVWICMELFALKASFMGILRKLSEAKGSPDALFLNLESLNVVDLLRGTARDGRKDHKQRTQMPRASASLRRDSTRPSFILTVFDLRSCDCIPARIVRVQYCACNTIQRN